MKQNKKSIRGRMKGQAMKKFLLIAVVAGCWAPLVARASDAGDLVFPSDYTDRTRWEVGYESLHRDIQITSESPEVQTGLDADVFALRLQTGIVPNARLDFEVGGMDPNTGEYSLLGGVGLRYMAFDHGPWRVGMFGQIRYVANVETPQDLPGVGTVDANYNWVEANVGALASYRFRVADQFALVPYAGPLFSLLRLTGDLQDSGREDPDFRAKENQFIGAAFGLGLEALGVNGIRAEMQIFDGVSFSVAAAFVY